VFQRHPASPHDDDYSQIKPREIAVTPRCPNCKTGNMFHPAHPDGSCWVQPVGEAQCSCRLPPYAFRHAEHCAVCATERPWKV
jgi:hypothetical protein